MTRQTTHAHTHTLDIALLLKKCYDTFTVCYLRLCVKHNLKCMFFVTSQAYSSIWVLIKYCD